MGGNCPGGNYPGGQLSWGAIVLGEGIIRGGGNCSGTVIVGAIARGGGGGDCPGQLSWGAIVWIPSKIAKYWSNV